jgi:NAD(P)-dependent dehydrogenase (short-subunit alcohol dehydrogenase family)
MSKAISVIVGDTGAIGSAFHKLLSTSDRYGDVIGFARSYPHERHIDVTNEASIVAAAAYLAEKIAKENAEIRLVIIACGLLHTEAKMHEKSMQQIDADWMIENFQVNALGPALVAKYFLPLMPTEGRSIFACLSARVGSISDNRLGGWHSYRASKAALNMLIRNLSIERQRIAKDAIIIGLQPGTVTSELSRPFGGGSAKVTAESATRQMLGALENINPDQSGQLIGYDGKVIAP